MAAEETKSRPDGNVITKANVVAAGVFAAFVAVVGYGLFATAEDVGVLKTNFKHAQDDLAKLQEDLKAAQTTMRDLNLLQERIKSIGIDNINRTLDGIQNNPKADDVLAKLSPLISLISVDSNNDTIHIGSRAYSIDLAGKTITISGKVDNKP